MKRRRKNSSSSEFHLRDEYRLHFRLCHVCLHLSESSKDIVQCQKCERYLTIESLVEEKLAEKRGESAQDVEEQEILEERDMAFASARRKGSGLYGLAVLW